MSILHALPDLLVALALLLLGVRTRMFPIGGIAGTIDSGSASARIRDLAMHLVLPVIALVLISLPVLVRHVDAAVRDALRSPFIQAARGHGIPQRRILIGYAFPAAANPLISLLGYSIGGLLSSSLLVEVIMGWPGLGSLLLESIFSRDVHVVIGATLVSALFVITGNLLADVLLYAADPRLRVER
jgi:peptide/nickel transport system permease protein